MTWTDPPVVAGIAAAAGLLVLCWACRYGISKALARRVLRTQGRSTGLRRLWRLSCLLASLAASSAVLFLLALLIAITLTDDNVPDGGVGLILAVAVGVIGNHVDRQMSSGWAFYWAQVHDSLAAVLTRAERVTKSPPPCQRTRFMSSHRALMDWDSTNREAALAGILAEPVCTDHNACPGHAVTARPTGGSMTRRLAGGLILIMQSPIIAALLVGWLLAGIALIVVSAFRVEG